MLAMDVVVFFHDKKSCLPVSEWEVERLLVFTSEFRSHYYQNNRVQGRD